MASNFPAEPLRWALRQAELDELHGDVAFVRALEVAIAASGPEGEALMTAVRAAMAGQVSAVAAAEKVLARARQAVAALESLEPAERFRRIARSRGIYRGVAIVEVLLERSREALPADGPASGAWARCALRAAQYSNHVTAAEVRQLNALQARAWAFLGNSSRIACDLREADRFLDEALRTIDCQGVVDFAARAEVVEIAARLQRARRNTGEAALNLRWSAAVWELLGRRSEQVRVLATLAMTLQVANEPREALAAAREGLDLAASLGDERLQWHLKHNEFELLDELGLCDEARLAAAEAHRLAERFSDSFTRLRVKWLDGRLARMEGRADESAAHLREVLAGFLADHNPYDAALVSLDLATLHLDAGRYSEAATLATAMAATFDALGVQREAYAACRLFADACERQRANVELAKKLARYLDQARHDPEYGFPASAVVG